eukprot:874265-Prorocentrum_minimum.AAC.1
MADVGTADLPAFWPCPGSTRVDGTAGRAAAEVDAEGGVEGKGGGLDGALIIGDLSYSVGHH